MLFVTNLMQKNLSHDVHAVMRKNGYFSLKLTRKRETENYLPDE